jgi:signal peptidase I
MQWISQLTEGLANLSVKMVLIAVGTMILALALFRMSRTRSHENIWLIENLQVVLSVVVVVFLIIRPFLFQAFYIPSQSMEPTLMGPQLLPNGRRETTGDRLLVNKLIYRITNPKRGDIAVFHAPPEAAYEREVVPNDPTQGKEFIKRVIGLPHETIEVVGPQVTLDGRPAITLGTFNPEDLEHPEKSVQKRVAKLSSYNGSFKMVASPAAAVKFDPSRVEVDGNVELEDREGRIREGVGLTGFGADLTVEARVYSVDGQPRLAVVTGNTLKYEPGHVRINGKQLRESYLKEPPNYTMSSRKLAANEYFMMGDNRNNSNDSHAWGPLVRERIIGRAEILFWPMGRFAVLHWWLLSLLGGFLVGYNGLQRILSPR